MTSMMTNGANANPSLIASGQDTRVESTRATDGRKAVALFMNHDGLFDYLDDTRARRESLAVR